MKLGKNAHLNGKWDVLKKKKNVFYKIFIIIIN